jgi:acid phosphatase class B
MKIGFDYWQVISHYPDQIAHLMFGLIEIGGSEIHVISAVGKNRVGTVQAEVEKAFDNSEYLVEPEDYTVHEVVFDNPSQSPELKLAKCKELGITMFFDDRDDVCRLLNKNGIMALRVTRKDNSTYDLGAERK